MPTANPPQPILTDLIIERDDGMYQLGWHDDAPGPFPSREFAQAVANLAERHYPSNP